MSKIINNISIVCNNAIFKYLEEDIVLSLNALHITYSSVDNNWEAAFTGNFKHMLSTIDEINDPFRLELQNLLLQS